MKNKNLYLDLHIIQSLPPANINRDDTGGPKTAQYGGVTRARVSSQSWKKAMRDYFKENSENGNVGTRSLDVVSYLAEKIRDRKADLSEEESLKLANEIFKLVKIKTENNRVKAMFFLGDTQAEKLADEVIAHIDEDKKSYDVKHVQEIFNDNPAIDIALFGRMVADNPALNEDASSQVAHAISTHAVTTEYDFFTAVDDIVKEDNAGASMLGTVEYNSSTLYRYANVAVHEFARQLDNDTDSIINALNLYINAFVKSLPTGKVNTFANQTLPQFVAVSLRKDRPVNLVTAFEKPIKAREDGYVKGSIEALVNEFEKVEKFVEKPLVNYVILANDDFKLEDEKSKVFEKQENLNSLLKLLDDQIREEIN